MLPRSADKPVLAIEASTAAGSVALFRDERLVAEIDVAMGAGRSDGLFPAVQSLLGDAELTPQQLGAIVCGSGPGSFTSLRIAAALAKGLAHGAGVSLFAVPSLLLAAASLPAEAVPGDYLVHADALRGERYALWVRRGVDGVVEPVGEVARAAVDVLASRALPSQRVAVGTPLDALPGRYVVTPECRSVPLAGGAWRDAPVDLASWEPAYGRLAEAQVKWEASHGVALPSPGSG